MRIISMLESLEFEGVLFVTETLNNLFLLRQILIVCFRPRSLQNIHLVGRWLGSLEKLLERCCEGSHPDYRVFMSAEPASTPQEHIIPQVEIACTCREIISMHQAHKCNKCRLPFIAELLQCTLQFLNTYMNLLILYVFLRASWKTRSRSQTNLLQACSPICTQLLITLTRWVSTVCFVLVMPICLFMCLFIGLFLGHPGPVQP